MLRSADRIEPSASPSPIQHVAQIQGGCRIAEDRRHKLISQESCPEHQTKDAVHLPGMRANEMRAENATGPVFDDDLVTGTFLCDLPRPVDPTQERAEAPMQHVGRGGVRRRITESSASIKLGRAHARVIYVRTGCRSVRCRTKRSSKIDGCDRLKPPAKH